MGVGDCCGGRGGAAVVGGEVNWRDVAALGVFALGALVVLVLVGWLFWEVVG